MMPSIDEDFLEVLDCVFIKGFPSNSGTDVSEVRAYFEQKVGKCCVQMTALSKDKLWSFVTLKFDSTGLAKDAIDRFHGKYIWGHKLQMSFWRVPKNLAQSERFQRNHSLNSRRWDDKRSFEEETENPSRHSNVFSRETNTKPTLPREYVGYDGTEEFRVDQDNRRYHEGTFAERRQNFNYEEHYDEYSQQYWNTDEGEEEAYTKFDENWDGWNSDVSSRNENLSERAYYNREEELLHAHEGDIWPERQEVHEREQDFDQYDSYPEIFQDNLREECEDNYDAYNERPFEDAWEEVPYRGEDLMPRSRHWYENQECTNAPDCRNQESNCNSFPSFDQERQWPRWEAVAPKSPSRRNPSDPDLITDTPRDDSWVENQRSCNERREFSGRRAAAFSDERPRSDEWLRNTREHFGDRGRRSASPVNVRPKAYGHRGPPHLDKMLKASPEISSYSARSRRDRSSISPARNRHSSANRESSRSLSAERNSDFRHRGASPGSERSSQAFNEQRLEQRKRESRSYSPNPNTKVPLLRERCVEDGNGSGGRRGTDLRRFLMLHQRRKHSSLRERSREKSTKHSERASKTSPDKRDKSPGHYSSGESSSSTQGINRKRNKYDDEKRRHDVETTKRRRKTNLNHSDNASTYSDQENGNRVSGRKNRLKTSERRVKQEPSQEKKGKSGQQREHVTDYSIKKRADRLLNDVAVTLTECKIPLRRPERKEASSIEGTYKSSNVTSVALKGGKSEGESGRVEHAKPVATKNLQSFDTLKVDRCTNETPVEGWAVGGTPEENITTRDYNASNLAVPCCEGSSDQDMSEVEEDYSSVDLSKDNLDYVEKNARTEEVSTENRDFGYVKKNWPCIEDNLERTYRVEVHESNYQRLSKEDLMANFEEEENSMQDDCTKDEPKTTNEPAEKLVHNFDFALSQSPVTENKIYTENDTYNEIMSTSLQHIRKEISSAEENTPKLDLAQEKWLSVDFGFYEESKNQFGKSNNSLTKVRRGSDGNVYHKDLKKSVQQTSCSCQEETSSVVHLPNKVFCYPVELNNTENAVTERGEEDHITERGSPDVTKADHKTSELSNDVLSFSSTRPEVLPPVIDVCRIVRNTEALKQGGYNTEESNCKNSGILAACTMEKVQVDATHTEQERYVSEREYRIHSLGVHFKKEVCKVEFCEISPQYIKGDSEVMTKVRSAMLAVNEFEDDVSFFRCQEATYTKEEVYILEGAKVTEREVYDNRDIVHVCNSRSEECQGKDADFVVTNRMTEQVCVASVNDAQQDLPGTVSVGEDNPAREDANTEDVVVDAADAEKEPCAVESSVRGDDNSNNVWYWKDKKHNSENAGLNTFNTETVCDTESNDFTSGFNDVIQRSYKVGVIKEEGKHDEKEHKVYNMVDGCVTQQEVSCSSDGNRSDNTRNENHTEINGDVNETDTDQECRHVDTNSYNMADAQEQQETRSIANNRTKNGRLKFSSKEVQLSEIVSKGNLGDIGTCYSGWTGLEPCNSRAAQAQYSTTDVNGTKSSAPSFIISNVNSQLKEHHLVTDDFEHVDMEISSEEDRQDHSFGSSICVNTSPSSIENDGCKLYSPSSPTWTSDEHRSPRPKDETSPYSPSHPTNASEVDVEVCITSEDVSCQGGERETKAPICGAIKVVCPEVRKNNSRVAAEGEEVLNFKQIIKGDNTNDTTPRSSRYSRSPKSGAILFQSVALTKDFVDRNLPAKDLMENRILTTSDENRNSVAKDSEVCSDSSTSDEGDKQNTKPLLRSKKRAKSLPVTVSMDAKPKVVYVTAAKTYDFYTNRGAQHKPRILYATNDKSAGPVRSLSLDTALGKGWPLCENSNNRPVDYDQKSKFVVVETNSTFEVEKGKDGRDTDGHVEPMLPHGSFIGNVPLKTTKCAAHVNDDDLEVVKINSTRKSARSREKPDNCTDCVTSGESSVGKEPIPPSCNAHQDTFPSRSLPKSDGLLVIQPPSALRQNHVPNEHCLSTDQIPIQLTESETNWKRSNVSNRSETPGTTVTENSDFGFSDQETSMSKSSVQPGSTVLQVEGENENDAQSECLREIQHLVLPLGNEQTLSNSMSCSANKRTHPDSTGEAPRPCKVPRKPLKLIIPTTPLFDYNIKRASHPAQRGKYYKKTSTSTVTHASVNVGTESNSLKVLQGDVSAISEFSGDKDTVMTEKDTYSENVGLAGSLSPALSGAPAITDCLHPTCETGNTSSFTVDSPPCKTPNENNNIMETKANSCSGKESEWIALRMERLEKKKAEIEQVYKRECNTVVNVVKMLVSNDPRLEGLLQNAVRRSLQDMGRRCVQELEKQVRPGS